MFLATTGEVDLWDTSDEILVLGPWCLRHDTRGKWEKLKHVLLRSPWDRMDAVEDACAYCTQVIERLLPRLATCLGEIHGAQRGVPYWRILLGGWLLYYVHTLYDRYVSLREAVTRYPDARTVALSRVSFRTPTDASDFLWLSQERPADIFNLQLYSQVLEAMGWGWAIGRTVDRQFPPVPSRVGEAPLERRLSQAALRVAVRLMRPRVMLGGLALDRVDQLKLMGKMLRRGAALPAPDVGQPRMAQCDTAARRRLADLGGDDEFTAVLLKTLPVNLPMVYLESYAEFRRACLRAWPHPPAAIFSLYGLYGDTSMKLLGAEFQAEGTRIIGGQHGGGYGAARVMPQERFELSATDRWMSYGWTSDADPHVHPLPHPRFLERRRLPGRPPANRGVLLLATSFPRYPFRFDSHAPGRFGCMLDWRARFVSSCRSPITVRLNQSDFGWRQREQLIAASGAVRFDDGRLPLRRAMRDARLGVVEYNGTALLELLGWNVPMVAFWDPAMWPLRAAAVPFFERLRAAGILHDTPEAAAAKVAEVYDDPQAWWGSRAVQNARAAFVSRYALAAPDWLERWVAVLQDEARSGR